MAVLSVSLIGSLAVAGPDGAPVEVTGAKSQALLAYLALNVDAPPSRDRLVSLLWGDRFPEQGRQSLRQTVLKLRRSLDVLDDEIITSCGDRIGLRGDRVETDVDRFASLVASNTPEGDLEAVRLYSGELLENLHVREAEFRNWLSSERQRMAALACPAFERAAEFLVRSRKSEDALVLARRLVGLDPLRESSHRLLMRILAQSGQRIAAVQQYHACTAALARELEVEPSAETQRLLAEIRQTGSTERPGSESLPPPAGELASSRIRPQRPASRGTAIAVLPLAAPVSGGEDAGASELFGEDLTEALSKYRWLEVRASPIATGERPTSVEMRQLARSSGLSYAVSYALRPLDRRMRLNVQLIELERGRYLWVHRYDQDPDLPGQGLDHLARRVAASVEAELVAFEGRQARELDAAEMSAWDYYHYGLSAQYDFTEEANRKAQDLFRRAIDLDPAFAEAHARLSHALVLSAVYFGANPIRHLLDEALDLAARACRLDPRDAVCRFALGRVYLARGDYERSISELERAIELNPSMAQAHCALGDSLTYAGRPGEAMPCFEKAVSLSPHDPYRWAFLSYGAAALLFKGDHEQSAKWSSEAIREPNCHFWAHALQASALGHLGRQEEARSALAALRRAVPGINCSFVRQRLFYLRDESQIEAYVTGLQLAGLE